MSNNAKNLVIVALLLVVVVGGFVAFRGSGAAPSSSGGTFGASPATPEVDPTVRNIGIVLDKGVFATDAIFTNRHEGGDLEDVEITATFHTNVNSFGTVYPFECPFSTASPLWKTGESIKICNFASHDFTRVVVVGTAMCKGKPVRIIAEKRYKD